MSFLVYSPRVFFLEIPFFKVSFPSKMPFLFCPKGEAYIFNTNLYKKTKWIHKKRSRITAPLTTFYRSKKSHYTWFYWKEPIRVIVKASSKKNNIDRTGKAVMARKEKKMGLLNNLKLRLWQQKLNLKIVIKNISSFLLIQRYTYT